MNATIEKANKPLLPKFTRADITAFVALLISVAALGVSVYEANIMREQQAIMQSQQKASFFPYVTDNQIFSYGSERNFRYEITNKGIGPAKIKDVKISLYGEVIHTYNDIQEGLQKIIPASANFSLSFSNPNNYFLNAKETIVPIELTYDAFENSYEIISNLAFECTFCYCSIFDDCWTVSVDGQQPQLGCN